MSPTLPLRARNRTKSSPKSCTRICLPPGSWRSAAGVTGIQYCRKRFPIKVPGPVLVSAPFSPLEKLCRRSFSALYMLSAFIFILFFYVNEFRSPSDHRSPIADDGPLITDDYL